MYTFNEIIGYEDIKKHLQNSIEISKISHAYIIDGQKGMGKKLLANTFAKTLQCEKKEITPCDTCTSCLTFDSFNHPDIVYVKPSKKTIGVDDIRDQINRDINIKPYHYPYKIYIINEANTMTEQAQNALLKTIEEPPSYAVIILLSSNSNMFLPTILSRCVLLKLKPISSEKIMNYINQELNIPDYQAQLVTSFSQGIIGKAKELASSTDFFDMRENMISIVNVMLKDDEYELLNLSTKFDEYKDNIEDFLDLFLVWFRDLLIVKKIDDETYLINRDKYKTLLKQARVLSYNKISVIISNIRDAKRLLRQNSNFRLVIEMMILQTKEK
ncbi:MAG: DNA polymerase III subunit delta' [Vallitalea sp.]|jgi:DNA polymerase-3 subunit delta'|nr:DNA polymerase III subunit delta' [Vallitalea sp.]